MFARTPDRMSRRCEGVVVPCAVWGRVAAHVAAQIAIVKRGPRRGERPTRRDLLQGLKNQQARQPDGRDQQPEQHREADLRAPGRFASSPHGMSCRRYAALPLGVGGRPEPKGD